MLYMKLRRFRSMMGGVMGMPAGTVSVVCRCFVISVFMVLCRFAVMLRRMVVVLRRLMMVLRCFFRHFGLQIDASAWYFGD